MNARACALLSAVLACSSSAGSGDGDASEGTTTAGTDDSTSASTTGTSAPETGNATTQDSTIGSSDTTTTAGETDGAFVLQVSTELVAGRLVLRCNLPPRMDACVQIAGAPCIDDDADGLADAWEDAALDRLRPLRRLDEAETLVTEDAVLGDVGRVAAVGERLRVFVMLGYSRDYGSCGFTAHNGDSERVALDLAPLTDGDAGDVEVVGAYTAAHEGTANDHGHVFVDAELDELVFGLDPPTQEPRWVIFASADKHASYATVARCEGASMVPCLEEDCAPDGVADPAAFDRLPVVVNAGEETAPRVTTLDEIGFVGDDAWAEQDFCGGLGGSGCSAPVREKLLVDPF